jgi:nitrilase
MEMKVGLAQISPVWLDKFLTMKKIIFNLEKAHGEGCDLVIFGEGLLPGYPFWIAHTNGAEFDSSFQKDMYFHYALNAVCIEKGDLDQVCEKARELNLAIYLGIIERPLDRGGHSLYCSLVHINARGEIVSVHRKLQPTYEERLAWSPGDGHGLKVHDLAGFRVGGLNCWENWMPLPRAALYAMGENVHVAVWPGSDYNTRDITRFIARESRSYVISVSGLLSNTDIPSIIPNSALLKQNLPEVLANGGSCVAGPDGEWIIEPQLNFEGLLTAELDLGFVLRERQNFDPSGHYSRPDVTRLSINSERQGILGPKNRNFEV